VSDVPDVESLDFLQAFKLRAITDAANIRVIIFFFVFMFNFFVDRNFLFLYYDVNLALILLREGGKNGETANCAGELSGRKG
jgi:hypothetical protein